MIAAPTLIPLNPLGAKVGVVHCSGRTYLSPTMRHSPMLPTLIATITVFTQADSFVPMTSSHVMTATMTSAGRLKITGIGPTWGAAATKAGSRTAVHRSVTSQRGISTPTPRSNESKYPAHPIATAMLPTAYSRIRSQPMIHATSSPSVAYAYVYALPEMVIIAANSGYVIAAKALVAPARMIDTTIADPVPTCPASPLIAVPMAAKITAPMMAPMPSAVSCSGPSERCRPPPASPSAMHWSTVLRRNSCVALDKQRRQHQRDRAQQLDEHMERRAGGVLERIADRVTHDGRLVGGAALPAVLTRLDVFLGIVPRPAAVVQHRGHQDAADGAHHQERGHRLGADVKPLEHEADGDRHPDREQARRHHLLERADRDDVHGAAVVGLGRPLEDAGVGLELATHLLDHVHRGLGDGADRQRREPEHQHRAEQTADEHLGLRDVHGGER